MQYVRDLTTIEEILSTDEEKFNKFLDETFYDPKPGDFFFIKGKHDKAYLIQDIKHINYNDYYIYNGREKVKQVDTLPLFTSGNLIDMMRAGQPVELRSLRDRWLFIFDDEHIYTSEEEEVLVSFLLRVIKDI
ncbi:hypothetical protein, partial [Cryptosporangium minutisporangium]|uniref:hypothetical protein n=1 Tax=Cryptosporangium minutisporangium TaxID=113569 RepID=UPI0035F07CCD